MVLWIHKPNRHPASVLSLGLRLLQGSNHLATYVKQTETSLSKNIDQGTKRNGNAPNMQTSVKTRKGKNGLKPTGLHHVNNGVLKTIRIQVIDAIIYVTPRNTYIYICTTGAAARKTNMFVLKKNTRLLHRGRKPNKQTVLLYRICLQKKPTGRNTEITKGKTKIIVVKPAKAVYKRLRSRHARFKDFTT